MCRLLQYSTLLFLISLNGAHADGTPTAPIAAPTVSSTPIANDAQQEVVTEANLSEAVLAACGNTSLNDLSTFRLQTIDLAVDLKERTCRGVMKITNCLNPLQIFMATPELTIGTSVDVPKKILQNSQQECLAVMIQAKIDQEERASLSCGFEKAFLSPEISTLTTQCTIDKALLAAHTKQKAAGPPLEQMMQSAEETQDPSNPWTQVYAEKYTALLNAHVDLKVAQNRWIRCYNSWGALSRVRLYKSPDNCIDRALELDSLQNMQNDFNILKLEHETRKRQEITATCEQYVAQCNAPSSLEIINTRKYF